MNNKYLDHVASNFVENPDIVEIDEILNWISHNEKDCQNEIGEGVVESILESTHD